MVVENMVELDATGRCMLLLLGVLMSICAIKSPLGFIYTTLGITLSVYNQRLW